MRLSKLKLLGLAAGAALVLAPPALRADDSTNLLRIDHYVRAKSTVPSITGQDAELYVREVVLAGNGLRSSVNTNRVVLFVHGAGTPAEVSFDVPYQDYSWMAFLARAGFDVFSVDMTGYGRSTRPPAMSDPCNLSAASQTQFVEKACTATYPKQLTTIASDWHDIDAAVDYLRGLRHVDKLNLVAWSLGGPRAGGYTSQHPEKVNRLVILAPAYNRNGTADAPKSVPGGGAAFTTQSLAEFTTNWDRQVGCPDQYDPAASRSVWSEMLASDPVGATWGTGVRRAPSVTNWGWNQAVVAKMQTPTLMISGVHDKQVNPTSVRNLYEDIGSKEKVFVDLACSSHNAMWERNHLLLFKASLEWLTLGTVQGAKDGMLKLGY
ncbi:MAG: alpha/beta fold hydrolase [Acidobacteriota bacterium]